jgi:hypothetical protein
MVPDLSSFLSLNMETLKMDIGALEALDEAVTACLGDRN